MLVYVLTASALVTTSQLKTSHQAKVQAKVALLVAMVLFPVAEEQQHQVTMVHHHQVAMVHRVATALLLQGSHQ